jgi:hypothetical protein
MYVFLYVSIFVSNVNVDVDSRFLQICRYWKIGNWTRLIDIVNLLLWLYYETEALLRSAAIEFLANMVYMNFTVEDEMGRDY